MKLLITGANGQLGYDLMRAFDKPSYTIYPFSKQDLDITNHSQARFLVQQTRPDIIINAAAYTNVDLSEENMDLAFQVNSIGVYSLVKICKEFDISLVHFSTDYVFEGLKSSPYEENDPVHPLNIYGISNMAYQSLLVKILLKLI